MSLPDSAPPSLISLDVAAALDLTNGPGLLHLTVAADDVGAGVDHVVIQFDHSWQTDHGLQSTIVVGGPASSFIDGSASLSVEISESSASGDYRPVSITLFDRAGNSRFYDSQSLATLGLGGAFHLASAVAQDNVAPTLAALSFPALLDVTGADQSITIAGEAFDTGTGVDRVLLSFDRSWQGRYGLQSTILLDGLVDSFDDGRGTADVLFRTASASGDYRLLSATVTDKAGNVVIYDAAALTALGLSRQFTIASAVQRDDSPPHLDAIGLPDVVDISSSDQLTSFQVSAVDQGSGVDHVLLVFDHGWQGPNGLQSTIFLDGLADSFADGHATVRASIAATSAAGTYGLSYALITDHAGNTSILGATELAARGMPTSFSIVDLRFAPTATLSGPSELIEGQSATLKLTLLNVSQWTGSISITAAPGSAASAGQDFSLPVLPAQYSVTQSVAGTYVLLLPPIETFIDPLAEPVESLRLTIRVAGQLFDTGTDSKTIDISLIEGGVSWTGTAGADRFDGSSATDHLDGGGGDDRLTGGPGRDWLAGGAGRDLFIDTAAGFNGDTLADFAVGDRLVIYDGDWPSFDWSLTGTTLSFTGGTLAFSAPLDGHLVARRAPEGGVELRLIEGMLPELDSQAVSDFLANRSLGLLGRWFGDIPAPHPTPAPPSPPPPDVRELVWHHPSDELPHVGEFGWLYQGHFTPLL